MNEKKLTIIKWIFDIALIIILSFIYYLNKPLKTQTVLNIPKGSINKIITHLRNEKYDVCKIDSIVLRLLGLPQSGWINMGENYITKGDFLYKIVTAKAPLQDIILIPGETTYMFLMQIATQLHLNFNLLQKEFNEQSDLKEGAFIPNTYKIPVGITEKELISVLLKKSDKQMKHFAHKIFGNFNKTKWVRYLSIASVIQKESANNDEMPIVSSVIYNRMAKKMKLQMDGALNYAQYSHQKVTPKRIKEDDSIYNTYKFFGIPAIPVCNVSFEAIMAAVFPAKTNYLYFMKSKNGMHDFSCNYSTHLGNIQHATK